MMDQKTEQLEKMCRRQALIASQAMRAGVGMLKQYELIDVIEGHDKGKTFIDTLTSHMLSMLQPAQSKTLTLKKSA